MNMYDLSGSEETSLRFYMLTQWVSPDRSTLHYYQTPTGWWRPEVLPGNRDPLAVQAIGAFRQELSQGFPSLAAVSQAASELFNERGIQSGVSQRPIRIVQGWTLERGHRYYIFQRHARHGWYISIFNTCTLQEDAAFTELFTGVYFDSRHQAGRALTNWRSAYLAGNQ